MVKRQKIVTLADQVEDLENLLLIDDLFADTLSQEGFVDHLFSSTAEVLGIFDYTFERWLAQGRCTPHLRDIFVYCLNRFLADIEGDELLEIMHPWRRGSWTMESFALSEVELEITTLIGDLIQDNLQIANDLRLRLLSCFRKTCRYGNRPNRSISLRHLYLVSNARNRQTFFQSVLPDSLLKHYSAAMKEFTEIVDLLGPGDNKAFFCEDWNWTPINKAYAEKRKCHTLSLHPDNVHERERDQWFAFYFFIVLKITAPVADAVFLHIPALTLEPYRKPFVSTEPLEEVEEVD